MARFLIVGLGNPGRRYEHTRHNIGFMTADVLAQDLGAGKWRAEHEALTCRVVHAGHQIVLAKPQTFMNNSGSAVRALVRFAEIPTTHLLVLSDDLDLPFGRLRLRSGGSAGGHNGLKSIIAHLGTEDFPRLKIGIGRPLRGETIDWVLSDFGADERPDLALICSSAARIALQFIDLGVLQAMNLCNAVRDVRGDTRSGAPSNEPVQLS